jgi:ABC-type branched-subunit amino acid transport system substrate-binding protein
MLVLLVGLFLGGLTACPQATPVVGPAANLAVCIADDAIAGKSLVDIVKDCATDLETVVVAVVNAVDPNILATKAHAEAVNIRAALYIADGGAAKGIGK